MNQLLSPRTTVQLEATGQSCQVEQFIGSGGQGEVYRATVAGKAVALKWYFKHIGTPAQRAALDLLVKKGPPTEKFLWPQELAVATGLDAFGYVMRLRDAKYKGIADLMKRRIEPSFRELATAAYWLADSYFQLHTQGLCYRDISFGNVFFNPDDGDVLICDNDNVTFDGRADSGVLGTPRFMAPEVVRGETRPSRQTDLFSLSVLLFYMFMVAHPLDGKKEAVIRSFDLPAMNKLYGFEPVFIWHPEDDSNRPVPGYHDNAIAYWPIYPEFIRRLFTRSFVDGVRDPQNGRVQESEWRLAMVRLRDSIMYCRCGAESFFDVDALRSSAGRPPQCWSCRTLVQLPFRIKIGRDTIVILNHDTKLYPHHLGDSYDFSRPIAEVVRHPQDPSVWGLKNLSPQSWTSVGGDGTNKEVAAGRSVTLAVGTRVQFGPAEGEIRA